MKKVLIVTPYERLVGGVEVVTNTLSEFLKSKGIIVEYLTSENLRAKNWRERILVKIYGLPYLTAKAYRKIERKNYSHVICNGEFGLGIDHPKAIIYFHGSYLGLKKYNYLNLNIKNKISLTWRSYIQFRASKRKKVVAVSEFLVNILKEQKIETDYVIHNPVDCSKFFPVKDKEKIGNFLFVGRCDYKAKGIDILEKLAEEENKEITCYSDCSKAIGKLIIKPMVNNNDMNDVYNSYKMLLFPSRFESSGMVAVEALACGLPVLIHPVGIGQELKNIIPEFVIDDFLNRNEREYKIEIINSHYAHYCELARKYAQENFSQEEYFKKWMKVLDA